MKISPVYCECGGSDWQLLIKSQIHQCVICGYQLSCKEILKMVVVEGIEEKI